MCGRVMEEMGAWSNVLEVVTGELEGPDDRLFVKDEALDGHQFIRWDPLRPSMPHPRVFDPRQSISD